MQFGYNLISKTKDEYLREIAITARSQQTLLFIDTNILAYLYKLHPAARCEFFNWADLLITDDRLRIPAWAASEYLTVVTKKGLHSYTPKSKDPEQTKKTLEAMHVTAALFVDSQVLSDIEFEGDRTKFLNEFRTAIDNLSKFTRALKYQFSPEDVHEEIQSHLQTIILDSDLPHLCNRAHLEGESRVSHRIPPAFRDDGKPENKYGDLIIWFEILQYAASQGAKFNRILFITNDEKSDWVYIPQRREEVKKGKRTSTPNVKPEIKIADPRLVSEFARAVGHSEITICSLATLIEGLSKENAPDFEHLAAAIQLDLGNDSELANASGVEPQINVVDGDSPSKNVTETIAEVESRSFITDAGASTESNPAKIEDTASLLTYEPEALKDCTYQHDAPSAINEVIRELKSHNWYVQNPAIEKISGIRDQHFPASSWFVLGRNIYQAACGNSQKAMDFMANFGAQLMLFPFETRQHVLAGSLFEIYFNSLGEFRGELKTRFMNQPLQQVVNEEYETVRKFILHHLQPHNNRLKFLPGDSSPHLLTITSTQIQPEELQPTNSFFSVRTHYELQSVQLDGIELMQETDPASIPWQSTFTSDSITGQISSTLGIPTWAIRCLFEPGVQPYADFKEPTNRLLAISRALQ